MVTAWKGKRLGGYSGVKHTAKEIVDKVSDIKKYKLWVEPFSGLGRTAEYVDLPKVLNDKSEFANKYCKETFPDSVVEHMDFMDTINKYDSEDTFFLIDPPWTFATYDLNELAVCDRNIKKYYEQLLERVETLKGDWFILNSADEHETKNILRKSKWGLIIVDSEKNVIFGNKARTMICSNLFDPNYKQEYIAYADKTRIKKPKETPKEKPKDLCEICGATYTGMTYEQHEARPFHQDSMF